MLFRLCVGVVGIMCCTRVSATQQLTLAAELKANINAKLVSLCKDLQPEQKKGIYEALDTVGKLYDVAKKLDEQFEKATTDFAKAKNALVTAHSALRKADTYMKKESQMAAQTVQLVSPVKTTALVSSEKEEVVKA